MSKTNLEKETNNGTANLSAKAKQHSIPFLVKYDNSQCLLAAGGGGGAWSVIKQSKKI